MKPDCIPNVLEHMKAGGVVVFSAREAYSAEHKYVVEHYYCL